MNAWDRWATLSNLRRIREEGLDPADVVATIRANGYSTVADAVAYYATVQVWKLGDEWYGATKNDEGRLVVVGPFESEAHAYEAARTIPARTDDE